MSDTPTTTRTVAEQVAGELRHFTDPDGRQTVRLPQSDREFLNGLADTLDPPPPPPRAGAWPVDEVIDYLRQLPEPTVTLADVEVFFQHRDEVEADLAPLSPEQSLLADLTVAVDRHGSGELTLCADARLFLTIDPRLAGDVGNPIVTRTIVGWGNELASLHVDEGPALTDEQIDALHDLHLLDDWGDTLYFGAVPEDDPTVYLVTGPDREAECLAADEFDHDALEAAGLTVTPLYRLRPDDEPGGSCWIRGTTDA